MKNESERGPAGDLEQQRLRKPKKIVRVPCGSRAVPHVGSQMEAKLEPNGVKMAFEITSKLGDDCEIPFLSKKGVKASQHGRQTGPRMESKPFQEATNTQRPKMQKVLYSRLKIVLFRLSGRPFEIEI